MEGMRHMVQTVQGVEAVEAVAVAVVDVLTFGRFRPPVADLVTRRPQARALVRHGR